MRKDVKRGEPRVRLFIGAGGMLVKRATRRPAAGFRPLAWEVVTTAMATAVYAALAALLVAVGLSNGHTLDAFAGWWVLAGIAAAAVWLQLRYAAALAARAWRYRRDDRRTVLASWQIPPSKELDLGDNGRFIRERGCVVIEADDVPVAVLTDEVVARMTQWLRAHIEDEAEDAAFAGGGR